MQHAIQLRGVRKNFGQTSIIKGVDLAVAQGERVALIGPNGAGKSTLFNLISGRVPPSSGEIHLDGRRIDGLQPFQIARLGLSRSFQVSNLFRSLSVFENVRCALLWQAGYRYSISSLLRPGHPVDRKVWTALERVGLQDKAKERATNLTYADQRALEVAITAASDPKVILLDEPTAGMSQTESVKFTRLIRVLTEGKTLLTVEHDMDVVFGLADRIAVLVYGKVVAFDTPEAIRANAQVQEAYLGNVQVGH